MKIRSSKWSAAVGALVVALGLTACASSGSTAKSTESAGSPDTASTWVLGNIGTYSAPQSTEYESGILAWEKWTNAHGGIDGHPVKVITEDDQESPTVGLEAVKTLVQQDHVIALVGDDSNVDGAFASYIEQAGVPVVGGESVYPIYNTNPDFFTVGASSLSVAYGVVSAAKKAGVSKLGFIYYTEYASVSAGVGTDSKIAATQIGDVSVPYSGSVSVSAPNYTAACLAAQEAGVTAIFAAVGLPTVSRLASDCAQQGYHPTFLSTGAEVINDFATSSATVQGIAPTFPFTDDSVPATKAFQDAINQYFPGQAKSADFGTTQAEEWASGQLFAAAAKAAHLGNNPTAAEVKNGLYDLHDETLGGLVAPLTYTPGKPTAGLCGFPMTSSNGHWSEPQGITPICMTQQQYTQMTNAS